MIPFEEYGENGPDLHFAHPNAYPPASFRQFLELLAVDYHVLAMDQRPLWPHSQPADMQDWQLFADDLETFLGEQSLQGIIGVGHSLGAVTTMSVAWQHPQRFRALVLIEPVFLPPAFLQAAAQQPESLEQSPMAQIARKRRRTWPDRAAAYAHFRAKPVFQRWSDAALADYLDAGLQATADGAVALVYSPDWEAQIYGRLPLHVWDEIPRVKQPTLAVRAAESDTLSAASWQLWQTLQPNAEFVELPGLGHMATMERPDLVAREVLSFLRRLPPI